MALFPTQIFLIFRFLDLPVSMAGCISVIAGLLILLTQSPSLGAEQAAQQVVVYCSLDATRAQRVLALFSKASGIQVQVRSTFLSSEDALLRLHAEKMNPWADVWFGAKVESHEIAKRRGLLQVYQADAAVGDEFEDPEGYWTPFYLDPLAFGLDVPIQQERRLPALASWQDLLRPELKDQIRMPPAQSKRRQLIVATLVFLFGEERASEYLRRLDQNIRSRGMDEWHWFRTRHSGRTVVSVDVVSNLLDRVDDGLITVFPREGAAFDIGAISILRGARRLAAARRLVDWLRGVEGQNAVASAAAPLLPVAAATNPTNALERPPWPVLISSYLTRHTPR